jgi:hypothetical protein
MVIHSKTGKVWSNDFEFKKVQTIDKADVSACDVIYYHHPYDNLFHNISFVNAIDELHFDHIRNNPAVTLVHENTCEAIDVRFAEEVYQVITQNNLNPSQVRIVTADENHKNFLNRYLESKNIFNTTVTVKNFLLSKPKTFSSRRSTLLKLAFLFLYASNAPLLTLRIAFVDMSRTRSLCSFTFTSIIFEER